MGKIMKDLCVREMFRFDAKWWGIGIKEEKTPELLKEGTLAQSLRAMASLKN